MVIAGQWRVSVPWQAERGLVRYIQARGKDMFTTILQRRGSLSVADGGKRAVEAARL